MSPAFRVSSCSRAVRRSTASSGSCPNSRSRRCFRSISQPPKGPVAARAAASLRELPATFRLLDAPELAPYAALLGPAAVKAAVVAVLDDVRSRVLGGDDAPAAREILAAVEAALGREENHGLVEVVNATGVLLHTNLGRAPLAAEALAAASEAARGYSNLEFDLESGRRGSRYERLREVLGALTGAEDSLVVNNCAAAVLLVLDTFARSSPNAGDVREAIVSRGQLVEIGGGFRLPDVLRRSGAELVEVGTTNRVYLSDYERALSPRTALLFRSHTSNFRTLGFTADVAPRELAALGKRAGVPVVEDLGSGALVDLAQFGLPHERTVPEAVADGVDLVAFSGDKLLGGPQAGIVVGRASAVARLRANPLLRALRVDKATLAALAATLRLYLQPDGVRRIPLYALLCVTTEDLRARACEIAQSVRSARADVDVEAVATHARAGGGTAPLATVASYAVAVRGPVRPAELAARLRRRVPRVVARLGEDALLLDLRTVPAQRDGDVVRALVAALN